LVRQWDGQCKSVYQVDLQPEDYQKKRTSCKASSIIKDDNLGNVDIIDHWLVMNLAGNIAEFKQAFVDFDQALPYEN
jgi:hypothetical protein